METMISYIERVTKVNNLQNKPWKEVVDTVILPKMAGSAETRWAINDMFMNFVAEYAYDISLKDTYTSTAILEIGLQRLSCGAVIHEATPWPEPLPREYWSYSSKWDEGHVMTEGCYNFIMKAMEPCLNNQQTRSHALKILFGLMEHISPNDGVSPAAYSALVNFGSKAMVLFAHAKELAEKYATFDELYSHYAKPVQWQKHKCWFAEHYSELDWNKFFSDTQCVCGNLFKRWHQRTAIRKTLKKLSLSVVC